MAQRASRDPAKILTGVVGGDDDDEPQPLPGVVKSVRNIDLTNTILTWARYKEPRVDECDDPRGHDPCLIDVCYMDMPKLRRYDARPGHIQCDFLQQNVPP